MAELLIYLMVDVVAASITATLVAPLITAFDEAITRSASGENLWAALGQRIGSIILKPANFFTSTPFLWMFFVYAATYTASNSFKSLTAAVELPAAMASSVVTLLTALVNTTCGIAKDAAYAKMFGTKSSKDGAQPKIPPLAYATWFLRDLTAFAFILSLPPIIAAQLSINEGVAKFSTPILAQYFTTPLHVLGVNMCNMPGARFSAQLAAVRTGFFSTVTARQLRIIPPYSIGGVVNSQLLSFAPFVLATIK